MRFKYVVLGLKITNESVELIFTTSKSEITILLFISKVSIFTPIIYYEV